MHEIDDAVMVGVCASQHRCGVNKVHCFDMGRVCKTGHAYKSGAG